MQNADSKRLRSRGFRVSRHARDRYQFHISLFSPFGNVYFNNFYSARLFADQMNRQRDPSATKPIRAGHLNAMGLIDEVSRCISRQYRAQCKDSTLPEALESLDKKLSDKVDKALCRLGDDFPPAEVYKREKTAQEYLSGESDNLPHRQLLLEELLMLWLDNANPAYGPYKELIDDAELLKKTSMGKIIETLKDYFAAQPLFGPDNQSLLDMLRNPAIASPNSLSGQLEYIISHWAYLLDDDLLLRLLGSLDFIREEEKAIFGGSGPSLVYDYAGLDEFERFSQDKDWMPRVVLMAKNAYVWLDQLSKRYQRAITRLDQIPDEELDTLARRGFTGLWLIGLWERSQASKLIKNYCGNPDAVASAYSLMDYRVADDLGGDAALEQLKARAWQRGIRLASDMVPNHMGIDSHWLIEHPDWFLSLDHSPFPSYSFNGGDLSHDERVGIYIEDHYYCHEDAAVVFKRVDNWTGDTKFIYHGNDGTNMPWNDTAQLNFLLPEVREAVIQTILHVARQFPVIRFDAAMTLAKKHYQRLWFPEPGSGGAIPTRAEHGMTHKRFNEVFPVEFWREVVDRVAVEAPDTLLLAEAFWLMEGYFVRTLGMHRVYNSAFMNMLRDEENANYRSVIKNTMEFDPDILKRFVNFMNNPDERTAVDQFGKGDKYFGICAMMCTLPGLPMFGHGQVEAFTEKYGMEYPRAYWDEQADSHVVERHEREIFPLLHRRHIFAEAANFLLYDFYTPEGHVNEDVFAYSNRAGNERGLVVYHNRYAETRGWIKISAALLDKQSRSQVQRNLGEGLRLHAEDELYTIFRDQVSGLEYIRPGRELFEKGLYVELHAYQFHVFLDFREVRDNASRHYGQVCANLNGSGTYSVDEEVRELILQPVHQPFRELINSSTFQRLISEQDAELVNERIIDLLKAIKQFTGGTEDEEEIAELLQQRLEKIQQLPIEDDDLSAWGVAYGWLFTHALGQVMGSEESSRQSRAWLDEWLLGKIIAAALRELGLDEGAAAHAVNLIKLLTGEQEWCKFDKEDEAPAFNLLERLLQNSDFRLYVQINRFQEIVWFNHEGFHEALDWLEHVAKITADDDQLRQGLEALNTIREAEANSEYQVEKLLANIEEKPQMAQI